MAEAETKSDQEAAPPVSTKREGVPFEIPVLPLNNTTLFPETVMPLAVGRPRSVAAVEAALATEEKLLACLTVRPENANTSVADHAFRTALRLCVVNRSAYRLMMDSSIVRAVTVRNARMASAAKRELSA